MQKRNATLAAFRLTAQEWGISAAYTVAIFAALGTLTALWPNPWFIRMTPLDVWDYVILGLEAPLLGLYLAVRASACAVKRAGLGGLLGFLGFGCSICNKVLVLIFGVGFLLTYFEPVRYPIGMVGVAVLGYALYRKLELRNLAPRQSSP